jgi:phage baseplate assembly protein W
MSFDLRINSGDLAIGTDGDLSQVQDTEKLIQDILKMLMTPLGGNVFFPWYGSQLTDSTIGQVLDHTMTVSVIQQTIRSNMETLQKMQRQQVANGEPLSPNELLAVIESISVTRNTFDPTYYQIVVKVLTRGFKSAMASLDVAL